MKFGYSKITANEGGGFTMWKVGCFNLGGSIPQMIRNMLMRQGFQEFEKMVEILKKARDKALEAEKK